MAIRVVFILLITLSSAFAQMSKKDFIEKKINQLTLMTQQKMNRQTQQLENWLKNKNSAMPKNNGKLVKVYYYLGTFHAQLYAKYNSKEENAQDLENYRKAKHYLEACAAYEHNIDKTEALIERLDQIRGIRVKKISKFKWRALFEYISYEELALLKDGAGKENIYSPQRGFCAGAQLAYGNSHHEFALDTCLYASSGNVGAENTARYFQKDVTTKGIYFKPTYWKLLSEGEAALGFGVPVLLRSVDYT
ncbi:MAG: hypothetical protein K2P81_17735 [Bacteriovoracaceae bacterium]|nr:hypothetical protein [Bacteriovoracaceae bacterium]